MNFRNTIANTAVINIQTFMARHKTPDLISEYTRTGLLYYGEIPFLYCVFECTHVSSKKERGGYKVVGATFPFFLSFLAKQSDNSQTCHRLFQSQPILDTILVYFSRRGIKQHFPAVSVPGKNNPVGMLALVCTAVGTCQEIGLVALMFFFELLFSYASSQFPSMFPFTNLFSIILFHYLLITQDTQDEGEARFNSTSTGNSLKIILQLKNPSGFSNRPVDPLVELY